MNFFCTHFGFLKIVHYILLVFSYFLVPPESLYMRECLTHPSLFSALKETHGNQIPKNPEKLHGPLLSHVVASDSRQSNFALPKLWGETVHQRASHVFGCVCRYFCHQCI